MMLRTLFAAALVVTAAPALAESYRSGYAAASPQPEYRTTQVIRGAYPVTVRKEERPVIINPSEATGVVIYDIENGARVQQRPVRAYVYVSTDPYDHMH